MFNISCEVLGKHVDSLFADYTESTSLSTAISVAHKLSSYSQKDFLLKEEFISLSEFWGALQIFDDIKEFGLCHILVSDQYMIKIEPIVKSI